MAAAAAAAAATAAAAAAVAAVAAAAAATAPAAAAEVAATASYTGASEGRDVGGGDEVRVGLAEGGAVLEDNRDDKVEEDE
mgnify:CR=1 FL=1